MKVQIKLNQLVEEIESYIPDMDLINQSISTVPIAWQLHHSLSVLNNVTRILSKSDPSEYKRQFKFIKFLIFLRGSIPRGQAKAPKAVNKKDEIKLDELRELLEFVKISMNKIDKIPEKAFFNHPYFGMLHKKDSLKFLYLHTEHHLKIVRDIKNK